MTNKLIQIGINLFLFSLFAYFVQYEKQVDKVCNEIIKDYNSDLERRYYELIDGSKRHRTIEKNAEKIKNYLGKLTAVKTLNEADSVSQQAKHVINKLGWNFKLDYTNHRDLGLSIIDQFLEKFDAKDIEPYNSKLNIILKNQIVKSDSVYIELMPVFANDNFDSILINGVHNTCENPFLYKDSVQFVLFKGKNRRNYKFSYKTKHDEE
jgi:hypothetical protein